MRRACIDVSHTLVTSSTTTCPPPPRFPCFQETSGAVASLVRFVLFKDAKQKVLLSADLTSALKGNFTQTQKKGTYYAVRAFKDESDSSATASSSDIPLSSFLVLLRLSPSLALSAWRPRHHRHPLLVPCRRHYRAGQAAPPRCVRLRTGSCWSCKQLWAGRGTAR